MKPNEDIEISENGSDAVWGFRVVDEGNWGKSKVRGFGADIGESEWVLTKSYITVSPL
jgi:hypothetical protein